jgi:hypothetical protein
MNNINIDKDLPKNFSLDVYKRLHNDLEDISDEQLIEHYYNYGYNEGRMYNIYCDKIISNKIYDYNDLDIPFDFNPSIYKELNCDLINITDLGLRIHYYLFGQYEKRHYRIPLYFNISIYKTILKKNIDELTDSELITHFFNLNNNDNDVYNYLMNTEIDDEYINLNKSKISLKNTFITFIMPTIGRESLSDAVNSILNMKDNDWKLLIIFDGIKSNYIPNDNRIEVIEIEKKGKRLEQTSHAGYVRNFGINYINNTEWFGFIDDDDYLCPNYINNLKNEIELNKDIDVCLFRMITENNMILPFKNDKFIIKTHVGISFSIKKNVAKKYKFTNNNCEDYLLLKKLELNNIKIVITPFIGYFVRIKPYNIDTGDYPRIIFN